MGTSTRILPTACVSIGYGRNWRIKTWLRYRGSILGPFWQTITTAIMIGAMGFIYAKLFNVELENYLPMLAVGLILWQFTSGMITEGCSTFMAVQGIIQKVKLPSLHAYRSVYRNVLVLAHNFVIVPVVLIIFPHPVNWLRLFSLLPAFAFIVINGVTTSILLGMICARFRDVPPIVSSVVQVLFSSPRSFVHRARSARTAGGWCSTRYSRPSTWCVVRFSVSRPLLTHGRSWSPLPC